MKKAYVLPIIFVLVFAAAGIYGASCQVPPPLPDWFPPVGDTTKVAGFEYMNHTEAAVALQINDPGSHLPQYIPSLSLLTTMKVVGPTNVTYTYSSRTTGLYSFNTEIVFMNLTGSIIVPNMGTVNVTIGIRPKDKNPMLPSNGTVQQLYATRDSIARSTFNLYLEIKTPSYPLTFHNRSPKIMSTIITEMPPNDSTYEGPEPVYLYDDINDVDQFRSSVGQILPTVHKVGYDVGGIVLSVDKVGLLAPYIGLASTIILAATVASTVYVKRVKRRKEKQ